MILGKYKTLKDDFPPNIMYIMDHDYSGQTVPPIPGQSVPPFLE